MQAEDRDVSYPDPTQVVRVRLKTPPRIPRFLYGVSILSAMAFVMVWGRWAVDLGGLPVLMLLAAVGGALPMILAASREPPLTPVVELGFDRLLLPRTADLAEQIVLTYRDIDTLFMRPGSAGFVWVGTASATFMYPLRRFRSHDDAQRLHDELRARIEARLPDGEARLEAFESEASSALAAYRRPLWATNVLVTAIVAGTILTVVLRQYDIFNLVYAGGLVRSLVLEYGQWWRVGVAGWLSMPHDGLIAAASVGVFGMMAERLFGPIQVLAIVFMALLVGGSMSLVSESSVGLGASPVALGLYAALAFTAQSRPALLPVGFRPPGVWWIATGMLLVLLTFSLSEQDPSALIGGALVGVVLTALRLDDNTKLPLERPSPWWLRSLVVAAALATVACWGLAALNFQHKSPVETSTLLRIAHDESWGDYPAWNEMAWRVAIAEEEPAPKNLELAGFLAERAAKRADTLAPELRKLQWPQCADTLATVRYRQGRLDEAISIEREVLRSNVNVVYASQLARFLDARVQTGSSTVTANLPSIELTHNAERGFGVRVGGPVEDTITVLGVIRAQGRVQGLLRFSLSGSTPVDRTIWLRNRGADAGWPGDATIVPADVVQRDAEWLAWDADPEIIDLP